MSNTDLSEQPIEFNAESSKKARLDSSAFRGRVPVVFAFVGPNGAKADAAIIDLDAALIRFGERRIQLLVVVDGYPSDVAKRLGVAAPLITDDGLAEELDACTDDDGRTCVVVLGNDGRVVDVIRQLPAEGQAEAILLAVDSLATQFPERFGVLPDSDEDTHIDASDEAMSKFSGASFRQKLSWLTGDRTKEAEALAATMDGSDVPEGEVLVAAQAAVSGAHGDSSVAADDPVTSDVATAEDVIEKL